MKKIVSLIIAAVLLMSGAAMAELSVVQTTYLPVDLNGTTYVYFFAELTNTGEEDIILDNADIEIVDTQGNVTASTSFYGSDPFIIAPGATVYAYTTEYLDEGVTVDDIAEVRYDMAAGEPYGTAPTYFAVDSTSCSVALNTWDEEIYKVIVTVKNDTDETIYEPSVVYGLYDQNGKLIYSEHTTLFWAGLPAGQSLEFVFDIDSTVTQAWAAQGITPTSVNGLAFIE